jgi:urease accessory protein
LLNPRNHGHGAWVYLSGFGGGLVSGDRYEIDVDAESGTTALISTQASTKVYRSSAGCSQSVRCRVGEDASLLLLPDPVVCFEGARYTQRIDVDLAPGASALVFDGFTCGRSARGERWKFHRYESRSTLTRAGRPVFVDAVRLDPSHGPIAARMGRFEVVLSLVAIGARFGAVREAMMRDAPRPRAGDAAIAAASPIGADGAVLRVAGASFEDASRLFRPSFALMKEVLGDDPFARKW